LPGAARNEAWSRGAAVVAKSKLPWPMAVIFIIVFVMMCAQQFVEHRGSDAPTGGGASPGASRADPGATKTRRE
jgi:hypothetical protein